MKNEMTLRWLVGASMLVFLAIGLMGCVEPRPRLTPSPRLTVTARLPTPTAEVVVFPTVDAQVETAVALRENVPQERDDVALAQMYRGAMVDIAPVPLAEPLTVGTRQMLVVHNTDANVNTAVEAELRAVGDHAYFWFDMTLGNAQPDQEALLDTVAAFDEIYERVIFYFGAEDSPGVDGDVRVHVVNASPLTICDVTLETAVQCGLLGYFSAGDILPREVDPQSNEREMFVMNGSRFGTATYLEVLAHEFRHMIESNHDRNDWDWAVEGSATLAEDLLGYPEDGLGRANMFLNQPDQQLNRWTDSFSSPYYGQGYLLSRYIYDRLGTDMYRRLAQHPASGLQAIDALDLGYTGESLWLDWLVALVAHQAENAPPRYDLPERFNRAASERVTEYPYKLRTEVSQYGADYYTFSGPGEGGMAMVRFTGSTSVAVLDGVTAVAGERMWLANRANYSQAFLMRRFDLRDVGAATLHYHVYYDIEAGYDFAYVSVSADGGETWDVLAAPQMQSRAAGDDPGEAALAETFYTGREQTGWLAEQIDLTAYAGEEILLRFEYVTDPILTFGGFALDEIAIPEIRFSDGAEREAGWTAVGFVRATSRMPQLWRLQLVRFVDGVPVVERIELDEGHRATIRMGLEAGGGGRPVLIVAAVAPMTLTRAGYEVTAVLERE